MTATDETFARRRMLSLAGIAAATAALGGCLDDSASDDSSPSTEDDTGDEGSRRSNESETDGSTDSEPADTDAEAAGSNDETDTDADSTTEDGDGTESDDAFRADPGTEILFSGQTSHWEGLEPAAIEGRENPTLVLEPGADYTIGWTESNGTAHNIGIRDESGEVIDDLETDLTTEPGADQRLEFTAAEEMVRYVCDPHQNLMHGRIDVRRSD